MIRGSAGQKKTRCTRRGASGLTAPIAEIFCSVQGEGLYAGQRQVFLRFAGCNLSCRYCDEPAARDARGAEELAVPGRPRR